MSLNTLQKQHLQALEIYLSHDYTLIYLTIFCCWAFWLFGFWFVDALLQHIFYSQSLSEFLLPKRRLPEEENELLCRPLTPAPNLLSRESVPICTATRILWLSISPSSCQYCVLVTRSANNFFPSPPSKYFPIDLKLEVAVWLVLVTEIQVKLACITSRWKLRRQYKNHCLPLCHSNQEYSGWWRHNLSGSLRKHGSKLPADPHWILGMNGK